ncbi:MAG: AMP-binding protein [Bacillota bacterium]|nr:AMP-binding protein [Bacillota bacterium]
MTPEEKLLALNRTIEIARRCDLYRDRLPSRPLKSLDELRELPLTTKEDLRAASPWGLLCVPVSDLYQYHETFGTTGTPVSSWYTKQDLEDNAREMIVSSGVRLTEEDIVLIRFPYAISSAAHVFHEAVRMKGACAIPASSRSTVSPFPRIIDLLRKLNVTVLAGLPLQALLLAETAELLGLNPRRDFPSLRAICTAGESLSPAKRALLEGIWGVPLFNFYGMTEAGNVAADCEYGRLHVAGNGFFIVELLADDLQSSVEPGQTGRLVVTALRRQAAPTIRYLTGDRARWIPGECPCGRGMALEVRGRDQDVVRVGDRSFDLWDLEEIISHLPSRRFWVVAPTSRGLHFVVEQESGADPVFPGLVGTLADQYRVELAVDVVPKGTLYDRQELLAVGEVGKPRYIYAEEELRRSAHLKTTKL